MMRNHYAAASLTAVALALAACGQGTRESRSTTAATDNNAPAPGVDAGQQGAERAKAVSVNSGDFVTQATRVGLLEIQSSTIAQTRASRPEVREFARTMIKDHTSAAQELKAAAGSHEQPQSLGAAEQASIQELQNARAEDFDQRYMGLQEDAHEKAVALFESYGNEGDDPALKAFAAKYAPTLRQHLTEARNLRQTLSASSGQGGGSVGGSSSTTGGSSSGSSGSSSGTDTSTSPSSTSPGSTTPGSSSSSSTTSPQGGGSTGGNAYGGPTPLTDPTRPSDYPGTATGGQTDSTTQSTPGGAQAPGSTSGTTTTPDTPGR